ncbi:MFS transporter [Novosphingobium sp.]|uniref:MFS transporter n=1 Tax=Novosphingobium sp. TaxID=1874826 RepID=UPI0025E9DABD|nr:MFS transporter [Novosphingobium sp.]MCC6926808.1 MFS transporter [Novosphingobium sp.]
MSLFPRDSEWHVGWRIVAAMATANGTGISLMFFTFSMFLIPIAQEFKLSRGEIGVVQALIITAAIGAPVIGRIVDRIGFHLTFVAGSLGLAVIELSLAKAVTGLASLATAVALAGFIGGGTSSVLITRPVSAHFRKYRGMALGLVAVGVSISTMLVPPFLQEVIGQQGWRTGFATLALIACAIGLPLVLVLMPRKAVLARTAPLKSGSDPNRNAFLKERDFWLLVGASMLASISVSGTISQLSPMVQDEQISARTAAFGLSLFAAGQFGGKLFGGIALDRFDPRRVAVIMTLLPATGFLIFLGDSGLTWPILLACVMIGVLQGAEVDIFAYFIAHRFDVNNYGTVFGTLVGFGWIGTAIGITLFGFTYDYLGSYAPIQLGAVCLLALSTMLFLPVNLRREA